LLIVFCQKIEKVLIVSKKLATLLCVGLTVAKITSLVLTNFLARLGALFPSKIVAFSISFVSLFTLETSR
jgi:hypothetical protein